MSFISLFFILLFANAQSKNISGVILSKKKSLEQVHVYNINTQKSVISDKNGKFIVAVNEGDILHFSIISYKELQVLITKEIINLTKLTVNLAEDINTLNPVEISNHSLVDNLRIASEKIPKDINIELVSRI